MAKNIVILSDGTGQGASMPKAERTNVWKLWDATKKADPANQVTHYDEGLGAEHKRECCQRRRGAECHTAPARRRGCVP
jgi:uncharacterized protein (DUF2235 family)